MLRACYDRFATRALVGASKLSLTHFNRGRVAPFCNQRWALQFNSVVHEAW